MGCANNKAAREPEQQPAQQGAEPASTPEPAATEEQPELYGLAISMNSMGCVLLGAEHQCGTLVPTIPGQGTKTKEFLSMNPFGAIPTIKDKGFCCAESSAILRYMAQRYAPELYPTKNTQRTGRIDWAMDRFGSNLSGCVYKTIYPILGFAAAPADQAAAGDEATQALESFAALFLREKFIGGSSLSIADYKVAPFFFAWEHPKVQQASSVKTPDRIKQFNKDFSIACKKSDMLLRLDGSSSLKETLDKDIDPADMLQGGTDPSVAGDVLSKVKDLFHSLNLGRKGQVEIHGVPISMNTMGPALLVEHAGLGKLNQCMPGKDTVTDDFKKINPFGQVPTMKDGDYTLGESNAILRYLAMTYAPDLYPSADQPQKRAFIDWALDRFSSVLYPDAAKTLYVCFGFTTSPSDKDMKDCVKVAIDNLNEFCSCFLQDKFIGGDKPCIADFKIAPFFFAYVHRIVEEKLKLVAPAKVREFVKNFTEAVTASRILEDNGGLSIKEFLDQKQKPDQVGEAGADNMEGLEGAMKSEADRAQDIHVLEATEEPAQKSSWFCCGQ